MKKYIHPICDGSNLDEGFGFRIQNLFITAAHVISCMKKPIVRIDGVEHVLYKQDALLYSSYTDEFHDSNKCDIAVYKLNCERSPLEFSINIPEVKDSVECITLKHSVSQTNNSNLWGLSQNILELRKISGVVIDVSDNYIYCRMNDASLHKGNSGSPVLWKDKVVGVLSAGENDLCAFQHFKPIGLKLVGVDNDMNHESLLEKE